MRARLEARRAAIATEARRRAIAMLAERITEVSGVSVEAEADSLVLSGRGLARRLIDEPVLRWIGSLMR